MFTEKVQVDDLRLICMVPQSGLSGVYRYFGSSETKVTCMFLAGSWPEYKALPVFLTKPQELCLEVLGRSDICLGFLSPVVPYPSSLLKPYMESHGCVDPFHD